MEIRVTDLACARGGLPVLEGVSFAVATGTAARLTGPNGIGKTTLLRTLAGLQPALAGEAAPAPEAIAYAGHADGLKPTLTAAETLRFWARVFGARDIAPALAAFDLERLAERPVRHLSAGQRRRLGLARLVLTDRPVWLLDEPTVALDAESRARFAAAATAHLAAGGTMLAATHTDLGLPAATVDLTERRARPPADLAPLA